MITIAVAKWQNNRVDGGGVDYRRRNADWYDCGVQKYKIMNKDYWFVVIVVEAVTIKKQ